MLTRTRASAAFGSHRQALGTRSIALHVTPCFIRPLARSCHCIPRGATSDGLGIVIVDHGSRKKDSNDMLHEFGRLYQEITGSEIVEVAHMEIAEPTIEQAIGKCASRGAKTVVVAPYFLSRGRHIQEDIPALVSAARQAHPGVKCLVAEPIGIDSLMAQLISNRVAQALQQDNDTM